MIGYFVPNGTFSERLRYHRDVIPSIFRGIRASNDQAFYTVWHVYRTLEIPPRYLGFFRECLTRMMGHFVLYGTFTER